MFRGVPSCSVSHYHRRRHHHHHHHHHHHSTNTQGRSQQWAVAIFVNATCAARGPARRLTERRLRCTLRHERRTVAMALAGQLHHSANRLERDAALRRQTTRAREVEEGELHHAPRRQEPPPPGTRPAPVSGATTAGGDPAAHGIGFELVLDPVVPQMAEQLVEVVAPAPRSVSSFIASSGACCPPRPQFSKRQRLR